jgi:D-3-phosphoglycerate dehydrogenase
MHKVLLTDNMLKQAVDVFDAYPDIEAVSVGTLEKAELMRRLSDVDAVIIRSPTKLTAEVIAAGRRLRFVGRAGVGVDNIDVKAARDRGIVVMNVPSGNTVSTAEHTIALILALARRIPEADRSLRAGRWDRKSLAGVELAGKTLGVVGFGRVGREVARRMLAFSMRVIATDPGVSPEEAKSAGVTLLDLDALLRESDIVTVHVAMTRETEGLIADREIRRMRDGAFLVNCARGGVVDENAVRRALEEGKLGGVAFDVFANEPPGSHALFSHARSVFTPHLGGATPDARARVAVHIAETIAKALSTGELRDVVEGSDAPGGGRAPAGVD